MKKEQQKKYKNLYVKRRLMQLEVDIFAIIAQGIADGISKQQILRQVKHRIQLVAVQLHLQQSEIQLLWQKTLSLYKKMDNSSALGRKKAKKIAESDPKASAEVRNSSIYASIRARIIADDPIHHANQVMYEVERRETDDEIAFLLSNATTSPFFLASAHPNPAHDHADYEGRMYYDANWATRGAYTAAESSAIRAYIQNHHLQTVQWVVGPPVYLVRRPNCKHYLTNIPLQEVLHASARKLLQKHHLVMEKEQPIPQRLVYYRNYYNRLKVLEQLNKVIPCKELSKDIKHTKALVDKYS